LTAAKSGIRKNILQRLANYQPQWLPNGPTTQPTKHQNHTRQQKSPSSNKHHHQQSNKPIKTKPPSPPQHHGPKSTNGTRSSAGLIFVSNNHNNSQKLAATKNRGAIITEPKPDYTDASVWSTSTCSENSEFILKSANLKSLQNDRYYYGNNGQQQHRRLINNNNNHNRYSFNDVYY
jgi:hypothetical protein